MGTRTPTTSSRRDGRLLPIDSGFIVHNLSTYPNLLRLFGELGVETQPTDMSMSVRCDGCGLEYAGARGVGGIFAQPTNVFEPKFVRMLVEVKRFHRAAQELLHGDERRRADGGAVTLGDFLTAGRYTPYFVHHFMVPMVSCVWSCAPRTALEYPARSLFTFLEHHGALRVTGSPDWRTVVGGSRRLRRTGREGAHRHRAVESGAQCAPDRRRGGDPRRSRLPARLRRGGRGHPRRRRRSRSSPSPPPRARRAGSVRLVGERDRAPPTWPPPSGAGARSR